MTLESFRYQFRNLLKEMPKVCLLGVRGYSSSENQTGIYDDAIIRFIEGEIKIFVASVDPGNFYINHPINPLGCARLKAGLYFYALGEHHAKRALVQAEEVNVDRLDSSGNKVRNDSGYLGINIHSGGPEYLVGRFSAGCQVIKTDEPWQCQWLDFFNPIVSALELFKQKRVPYLLVDKLEAIPASLDGHGISLDDMEPSHSS
jgi:hypothetical protein